MELLKIENSNRKNKKLVATFFKNDKIKNVHFGDSRYSDFLQHKNIDRRTRYYKRHHKELKPNIEADTPSALSFYILWGPSTDINKNISNFKNVFGV